MEDSEVSRDVATRIEGAKSNLELAKIEALIKHEERVISARNQLYTLTLPILLTAASICAGAVSLYYENVGETSRQDSAHNLTMVRDENARRHDLDKRVGSLIDDFLRLEPKPEVASSVLCLHWATSDLSETASKQLRTVILDESLCGTSGGGFSNLIVQTLQDGKPEPDLKIKQRCIASPWIEVEAVAYDKSGFNSKPSGKASLSLQAPIDYFLSSPEITTVVDRRAAGKPLADQLSSTLIKHDFSGTELPVGYSAEIGCTNDRGTGRTCEYRVRVRAKTFPKECAKFFKPT